MVRMMLMLIDEDDDCTNNGRSDDDDTFLARRHNAHFIASDALTLTFLSVMCTATTVLGGVHCATLTATTVFLSRM